MTLAEFCALIGTLDIRAVYGPYQDAEAVPYITYNAVEKNVIHADGRVIYGEDWIELRLVTRSRDLTKEQQVEKLLTDNGIAFDYPDFDFDEKERIHTAVYNFMIQAGSDAAPGIKISASAATVEEDDGIELTADYIYPAGAEITWSSSDPEIATVANGTVTGVAAGTCIIYACIIVDGVPYTDGCAVTVTEKSDEET